MIMLKLQMITVEVIQMAVKANHDISSGLDTAFINSAINSNLAYRPEFVSNDYTQGKKVSVAIERELRHCDAFYISVAFITEGAIPYAASDPLHVIPACVIGSGIAGAMSMAFKCTLMAPHGGIFVVPVMGNALLYLVAVVIGTVVSAVLLGVLKKKVA